MSSLYNACLNNQYDLVVDLVINKNADVHWFSDSPLRIACFKGFDKIVQFLISKGADIGFFGIKCLLEAIGQGHLNVVKRLVEGGVKAEATALRRACNLGYFDICKYLIEKGADVCDGDSIALRESYRAHSFRIARLLLENGANPNAQGGECISILAKTGLVVEAKFLFHHGADIKLASEAVRIASLKGFTEFAWYLLSLGADKEGLTPFHKERYEREQQQRRHEAAKKIYYWIIPKLYAPGSESAHRLGMKGFQASMKGELLS